MENSNSEAYPFKNLVFRAGGILGIAYVGSIKALEEKGIVDNIERIAGSSAGSITAVAMSYGYSAAELKEIMDATKFSSFMDGWINPIRFLRSYGVYKGKAYLKWMKKIVAGTIIEGGPKRNLGPNATFKDFKEAGCKDLYIMTTDLNMQTIKELSYRTTPNLSVAEACRASMAIPGFFPAWKFTNAYPDDHIYIDGGVLDLFPISLFDTKEFTGQEGKENFETMGFYLANKDQKNKNDNLKFWHVFRWVRDLFETAMMMQQSGFEHNPLQKTRTVTINDHGISATNFNLSSEDETLLFDSGYKETKAWLDEWKPIAAENGN